MLHQMVVGTSEPQDFQLQDDGAAIDGTGWTVAIVFRESVSGISIAWLDQAAGTVRITGAEGLAVGTYHFRITLTDGNGDVGYVPSAGGPAIWDVTRR